MKKIFTLVLVMAMAIASFAQVKSMSYKSYKAEPAQMQVFKGFESLEASNVASVRNMMTTPEEEELSQTFYDWQSNMGARNFTAVWPDGFAVMCFTQATDDGYSDRGTGLLIWDPAVGEWEYTESHAEDFSSLPTNEQRTGFGSISRYKENGLVIAAHSANYCHLFFCEDFRNGSRDFSTVVTLPNDLKPTWPVVQCSGENLDIVHVLATEYNGSSPFGDPIYYYRYENDEWTASGVMLEPLNADHMSDGGSNICYFMPYDPAKPDRVSFILNNAWSDGKLVISEDNGATWGERVFYQHPGIHEDYTDTLFLYPRWTSAAFDANDNLHVVYEWNGTSETAGSGKYYPGLGGVAYWSEVLPKSELCEGGIGNVGQPFTMDATYMIKDLYYSEWYWSDAIHDPLPEYFGELQILDQNFQVYPWWEEEMPDVYYWLDLGVKENHGAYNNGITGFASMHMDGNRIFAFWSMIAGDSETNYFDGTNHKFRLFCNISEDGGLTWNGPRHLITDVVDKFGEMVYGVVIPHVYTDEDGEYLWYCFQYDEGAGTFVQNDDDDGEDNFYHVVKVHMDYILDTDENYMTVAPMINVYPNPAKGSFNVMLNNESNVNIYNAVGQLVKTYNNVTELNVNLEAGVYFVNAGNQTVKVVVK